MTLRENPLLGTTDPPPAQLFNAGGRSPFLVIGDHAGNAIPTILGSLGLEKADRERHIAWDIGVRGLGMALAQALDAAFIFQHYSRLVIDCNRDPSGYDAVLPVSDGTLVPGNAELSADQLGERVAAIHVPYHARIAAELARRRASARPTIILALHSFTPMLGGLPRPWDVGVLYDGGDTSFAMALRADLAARTDIVTGDNEPYRMDATDYSIPRHAYAAALPYAEIEVRQDHLSGAAGIAAWSALLCSACKAALEQSGVNSKD